MRSRLTSDKRCNHGCMYLYMFDERISNLSMICQIKQVPQALHPRNWTQSSRLGQFGNIQDFYKLANNRSDIVETATLISVADELQCGRFWR
jgi:hypothetical protein